MLVRILLLFCFLLNITILGCSSDSPDLYHASDTPLDTQSDTQPFDEDSEVWDSEYDSGTEGSNTEPDSQTDTETETETETISDYGDSGTDSGTDSDKIADGDDCSSPLIAGMGNNLGNLESMNNTYTLSSCAGGGAKDQIWAFTAPMDGRYNVQIDTSIGGAFSCGIVVWEECGSTTDYTCGVIKSPTVVEAQFESVKDQVTHILVDSNDNSGNGYILNITRVQYDQTVCDAQPLTCEDIGPELNTQYAGCCFDNTVYWCETDGFNWSLKTKNCQELGLTCGYSDNLGYFWCN